MCRGVENLPIVAAGLTLPPSTRLHLQHTKKTVQAGTLIKFASVAGKAGLMRQFNLVVNSSNYRYQEGCMSAMIDQTPLFLSSGLEDYFLGASSTHRWMAHTDVVPAVSGAYFHSMPTEHLPYSGFENIQPATSEPEAIATNSLAACAPKPVFGSCCCHSSGPQTNLQAVSDRIHEPDPLLFSSSFEFQWIASSVNRDKNGGFCNCEPIQLATSNINGCWL